MPSVSSGAILAPVAMIHLVGQLFSARQFYCIILWQYAVDLVLHQFHILRNELLNCFDDIIR